MAAVSANLIHHQQQSGHPKVTQDDQSEDESNDGSLHSITKEKQGVVSSPEYKAATPDTEETEPLKFMGSLNERVPMRSPNGSEESSDIRNNQPQFHSSFSMHNVLNMKTERESISPPPVSSNKSTDIILRNMTNYTNTSEDNHRNDDLSSDDCSKRTNDEEMEYAESEFNVRSSSPIVNKNRKCSAGAPNDDDGNSCCSDDTVLSVGNEAQVNSFESENRTCSTANSTILSPRSSPAPSPASSVPGNIQGLSSFKHIQSHLSAISQLSQNLHGGSHLLLRPNPITPNPLMFLNQNRLLFNPHLPVQTNVIDAVHQSPHSLSNSPTSINPALSRLSPNDLSPTSVNSNQMSPSPPVLDGSSPQNISGFAALPPQIGHSLRFYKQNSFPPSTLTGVTPNIQNVNDNFSYPRKMTEQEKLENKKMQLKALTNTLQFYNPSVNERLFSNNNNVLCNNPNITNNNQDMDDERHNLILNHNGLKFSIDNILKADFGRRITDPLHKRSKSGSSKHKYGAAVLNPLSAASGTPNLTKQLPLKHLNIKEPFGSSAFKKSAFHPSKESESYLLDSKGNSAVNNYVANTKLNSSSSSSGSSRLSSERLSTETRIPSSSDIKSVTSLQNNLVSSSVSGLGSGEKTSGGSANPMDLSKTDTESTSSKGDGPMVWPAWVYCTRYSDRPSSGPRTRRPKKQPGETVSSRDEEKRPRTAFSGPQLARLKHEFAENRYLTEKRRQHLSAELGLNEAQIKIWFQNKRAKIKKASGQKNPLALQLMAQGLYNHSTVPLTKEEEEMQELHSRQTRETKA